MTLILIFGAENETRTRDPNLGKVMLYQLSYFRKFLNLLFSISRSNRCYFRFASAKVLLFFEPPNKSSKKV